MRVAVFLLVSAISSSVHYHFHNMPGLSLADAVALAQAAHLPANGKKRKGNNDDDRLLSVQVPNSEELQAQMLSAHLPANGKKRKGNNDDDRLLSVVQPERELSSRPGQVGEIDGVTGEYLGPL